MSKPDDKVVDFSALAPDEEKTPEKTIVDDLEPESSEDGKRPAKPAKKKAELTPFTEEEMSAIIDDKAPEKKEEEPEEKPKEGIESILEKEEKGEELTRDEKKKKNSFLKDQLTQANEDKKALEEQLSKFQSSDELESARIKSELEVATQEAAKLREDLEAKNGKLSEYEKQLLATDASVHPDVKKLDVEISQSLQEITTAQGAHARTMNAKSGELLSLAIQVNSADDENYAETFKAASEQIEEAYDGVNGDSVLRGLIGVSIKLQERESVLNNLTQEGSNWQIEQKKEAYKKHLEGLKSMEEGWFKVDEEVAKADPYNPSVLISKALEMDEDLKSELGDITKNIQIAARPISPELPADQYQALVNQQGEAQALLYSRDLPEAMVARSLVPKLVKDIARLKRELDELSDDRPSIDPAGKVEPVKTERIKSVEDMSLITEDTLAGIGV